MLGKSFTYRGYTSIRVLVGREQVGHIARLRGVPGWTYGIGYGRKEHGAGENLSRKQAHDMLLALRRRNRKATAKRKANGNCLCRGPKRHRDCFYCGSGFGDYICGVCKEEGVDGKCIPGTARAVCRLHKPKG